MTEKYNTKFLLIARRIGGRCLANQFTHVSLELRCSVTILVSCTNFTELPGWLRYCQYSNFKY